MPAYHGRCEYCGSSQDVDRELLMRAGGAGGDSKLACPICAAAMKTINLGEDKGEPLYVDQCGTCFGLFFPFYKLEIVLNDLAKFGCSPVVASVNLSPCAT